MGRDDHALSVLLVHLIYRQVSFLGICLFSWTSYTNLWWNMEIIIHLTCRSDLRIAIRPFDSRESEFPPTIQNVELIV